MTHDDRWLDAFGEADLRDPDLPRIDAAVARLAAGRARPRRRWAARTVAGAALAAAAMIAFAPDPPSPTVAPVAHHPPPAAGDEEPPAPIAVPWTPGPERVAPDPPADEVALVRPSPGLLPASDAVVVVADGRATLIAGRLGYVHDAQHEPGVRSVAFADLPVTIEPVGTAFTVEDRDSVGAIRVTDGSVRVVHDDGTVLASLSAGDDALVVIDPRADRDVVVLDTTGKSLDAVRDALPIDCLCRPRDAVAAIASLRFITRGGQP